MKNYLLSCTSTVDLSKEHLDGRQIHYICLRYSLGGVDHPDDLGLTMPFHEFYTRMAKGEMTKTSQPSIGDYVDYFGGLLSKGNHILHVCLSSGLSGDYNSATLAATTIMDKHPEAKIIVIDSLGASSGSGLLMDKLADLRDEGMGFEELAAWAEEHRLNVHHWFFSTDLKYYVRGGRVKPMAGFIGNLLHICPLLNMDNVGHLIPRAKLHGSKKAMKELVNKMKEYCDNGLDYGDKVFISNSDCMEFAEPVARMIEETFPHMKGKVVINSIGTTIGAHTGPGTLALFFWGKKRID